MGLGLQRKVIGDILVHSDFAQIITAVEVEDIIELKLEKVHQVPVEVKVIDESDKTVGSFLSFLGAILLKSSVNVALVNSK